MTRELEAFFQRYGVSAEILPADGKAYIEKVFFQPVRETDKEFPFAATSLGTVDDRRWICLSRHALREGDRLRMGGGSFAAVNCAAVYLGEEPCHWRAVLVPEREAAE